MRWELTTKGYESFTLEQDDDYSLAMKIEGRDRSFFHPLDEELAAIDAGERIGLFPELPQLVDRSTCIAALIRLAGFMFQSHYDKSDVSCVCHLYREMDTPKQRRVMHIESLRPRPRNFRRERTWFRQALVRHASVQLKLNMLESSKVLESILRSVHDGPLDGKPLARYFAPPDKRTFRNQGSATVPVYPCPDHLSATLADHCIAAMFRILSEWRRLAD